MLLVTDTGTQWQGALKDSVNALCRGKKTHKEREVKFYPRCGAVLQASRIFPSPWKNVCVSKLLKLLAVCSTSSSRNFWVYFSALKTPSTQTLYDTRENPGHCPGHEYSSKESLVLGTIPVRTYSTKKPLARIVQIVHIISCQAPCIQNLTFYKNSMQNLKTKKSFGNVEWTFSPIFK